MAEQSETSWISQERIDRSRRSLNKPSAVLMQLGEQSGIFFGWIIAWASFALLTISAGITYSTPVMFPFFETDFAIGKGQAAFVFSCSQLLAFLTAPIAGALAEKLGPRVVVGGGLLLLAAGLTGAALAKSYILLVVSYGIATGLGSGSIYVPLLGLIQRWFYRYRGRASGLATAGVSVGTLTFPIVAADVAGASGWRACILPSPVFVFQSDCSRPALSSPIQKKMGLKPDGALDGATPSPSETKSSGLSLKEAVRDRQFYLLCFCSFGTAVLSFMALVHLPQQVAEASHEQMHGAAIISVIGLSSLVSRVGGGSWADKIGRIVMVRVALVVMLITSILWASNVWGESVLFVVAVFFGITYGLSIALLPSVIADCFGSKEISRIIGAIYTSFALAALLGPTVAGLLRDRYGNYDLALALCIVLSASAVIASTGIRARY